MCADHPTASELYERVRQENPTISRATVFRVLSQFAANGTVKRISLDGHDARYDAKMAPHAHLCCAHCGRVFDLVSEELTALLNAKECCGYKVYSAELDFVGVCKNCNSGGHIN